MPEPKRIQRKRTKGWRMPENTVYVGRPSKWGNPYVVGNYNYRLQRRIESNGEAVDLYRSHGEWRTGSSADAPSFAEELRGKDLACWCALDQPCHADVLLEWANAPAVLL